MSGLPKGWVEATFSQLSEIKLGKMLDKEKNKGKLRPYLRNVNVRWEHVDLEDILEMRFTDEELEPFGIRDGDLLVCEGGEPGRCAVWQSGPTELKFQKALMRLRPRGGVESTLMAKMLRLMAQNGQLQRHFTGTTIKHLPQSALAAISVPLPPLAEQKRIVAKLDALNAKSARARTELARIETLVSRYKQAVLSKAFSGELAPQHVAAAAIELDPSAAAQIDGRTPDLPSLPAAWNWVALCSVADISGGLTKNSNRGSLPLQLPYLRVANVYANELRLDDVSIIGCTENEVARTTLRAGDLLLVEGNGSLDQIGRVALWGGELDRCVHQNHLIKVRPGKGLESKFALYWLLSPLGRRAIEAVAASSAGLHTLSLSKVGGLPLPLCSTEEQHEIVRRVENAFAKIDRLAGQAKRALQLVGKLDEAILAKAFRGELVPQDENDEPAGLLLERIRQVRSGEPARPRRRASATKEKVHDMARTIVEALTEARDWLETQELFALCGVQDGSPTEDVETLYRQLLDLERNGQIEIEEVADPATGSKQGNKVRLQRG